MSKYFHVILPAARQVLAVLACGVACAGCGHDEATATKAVIAAAPTAFATPVDLVAQLLAHRLSVRWGGGCVEVPASDEVMFPGSWSLYAYSTLRRYPKVRWVRVYAGYLHSDSEAVYDRRAQTLRFWDGGRSRGAKSWLLTGFSPQMLLDAGRIAINDQEDPLDVLAARGAKRVPMH